MLMNMDPRYIKRCTMRRRLGYMTDGDKFALHQSELLNGQHKEAMRNYSHQLAWEQHADTMEMIAMRHAMAAEQAAKPFWRRWFGKNYGEK